MQSPYNVTIRIKAVTSFLLGERCETCDVVARKVFQLVRRYYKKTDACYWASVSVGGHGGARSVPKALYCCVGDMVIKRNREVQDIWQSK